MSLNLDILNDPKKALSPRSSGGEHGLEAGRLQLANGTMMVVNEGSMQEGQLKENGESRYPFCKDKLWLIH